MEKRLFNIIIRVSTWSWKFIILYDPDIKVKSSCRETILRMSFAAGLVQAKRERLCNSREINQGQP